MFFLWFALSCAVSLAAVAIVLPSCVETYMRYSRARFVICPENQKEATITLSARLAALTSAFLPTIVTVKDCNAWGDCRRCSMQCLTQVR